MHLLTPSVFWNIQRWAVVARYLSCPSKCPTSQCRDWQSRLKVMAVVIISVGHQVMGQCQHTGTKIPPNWATPPYQWWKAVQLQGLVICNRKQVIPLWIQEAQIQSLILLLVLEAGGGGASGLTSQTSLSTRPAGTAECTRTSAVFTAADAVTSLPNLADCTTLVNANTLQTPWHSVRLSAPKQSHTLLFQAHSLSTRTTFNSSSTDWGSLMRSQLKWMRFRLCIYM